MLRLAVLTSLSLTASMALAQDIVTPAAPSALIASAIAEKSAQLSWKDNASNESGFELLRSGVKVTDLGVNSTSYALVGLIGSTSYSYTLKAFILKKGRRTYSAPVTVTFKTLAPPPPAPVPAPVPAPAPTPAPAPAPVSGLRAFPTAEGFGARSVGGRAGKLFIVSSLADAGAGTLRECVEASGARTCVFSVSGTILLDSALAIKNSNITIAGQTSPGGIQLRNRNNLRSPILIDANDVIIRHLRVRPGPSVQTSDLVDAITISSADRPAQRIMIDHVSMSWATDELVQTGPSASDVTVQWSMVYEGLSRSTHVSGEHSKGPFLKGNRTTLHMNYVANNTRRMPNISSASAAHQIDLVNNVFYNAREAFGEFYDEHGKININLVGNLFQMGPESFANLTGAYAAFDYANSGKFGFALYLKDNLDPNRRGLAGEAEALVLPLTSRVYQVAQPVGQGLTATAYPAKQASLDVMAFAGATLPVRDAQDLRVVREFFNCQGSIIDDPAEVGGWPSMLAVNAAVDSDRDGMSDSWEDKRGLNKASAADMNLDDDKDGYTNLEEYINELAGDHISVIGKGLGSLPIHRCGR